jgi:hypothetical protein
MGFLEDDLEKRYAVLPPSVMMVSGGLNQQSC